MKRLIVLYIDDEADTEKFKSKCEIMREEGIDVIGVTSVRDAIPKVTELAKEIDLILLDIIMPPEDYYTLEETNGGIGTGFRLLQDIREVVKDIPIIIVSIRRKNVVEELLKKYNIRKFLEKPLSTPQMITEIKNLFSLG